VTRVEGLETLLKGNSSIKAGWKGLVEAEVLTSSGTTVTHLLHPLPLETYKMLGKNYLALAVAILPTVGRSPFTATLCMLT
jgi:hypothetical protein